MTVYVIARMTIHDRDAYNKYDEGFMETFEPFGGTILSVDEAPTVLQGEWTATRSILLEFPSKDVAMAWMTSPAYQEVAKHRLAGSTGEAILVNAFTGIPGQAST